MYWFGHEKVDDAFSILKEDDCLSYEEGIKKGLSRETIGSKKWDEMQRVREKHITERLPFQKLREFYEYVVGPRADRLLVELETEMRQQNIRMN